MSKTIIITGASGSMGSAASLELVKRGWSVIMACRNPEKGEGVRQNIIRAVPDADITLRKLNLESCRSVHSFVESIKSDDLRIDALFNNAGVISRGFSRTEDGFENTLAVNYIGPYLLTTELLPVLNEGAGIVNMVSLTCKYGNVGKDLFDRTDFKRLKTYSDTKLALLLFSIELSRRCPSLNVNVSDPGIVDSNMISMGKWFDPLADILFRPFCSTPEKGVAPALRALESGTSLHYYVGKGDKPIPSRYLEHPLLEWLWDETAKTLE